jgi:serine/threonine protein kinase
MSLTRLLAALPEPLFSTYNLTKVLGVGAYAVVYQVQNKKTRELFALKVMEKEPVRIRMMLPQLMKEVAIVQEQSGAPHIVQLFEVTETDTHFFLRFELCQSSMEDYCKEKGPMTEHEAFGWLRQACLGVKELHDNGVVHRDIKPSNFLIDSEGALCICDFGFAGRESECLTGITGTHCYACPELKVEGPVHTQKVDIYALGACLQHFLLGRCPQGPKDLPRGMSAETKAILVEMLSADPNQRPDIDDLLQLPQLVEEDIFTHWWNQGKLIWKEFSRELSSI